MMYHDDFIYPPSEPLTIDGIVYSIAVHPTHVPLKFRREEYGMSQQQVADASGITLRQYQRFESGERELSSASMRIGLSICHVLKLDPYRFIDLPTSE